MLNSQRKSISDSDGKAIIDTLVPEEERNNAEEYEAIWEEVIEASKCKSITQALAVLTGRDPRIVLEIHKINPWKPTPDEANILRAFLPNYLNAIFATRETEESPFKNGELTEEILVHTEKVCTEVYDRSIRELDAERRGAF